ncbi:GtrA family protein [Deefgea sp. CFH1-16]|uniref:GtrA family protein n=1 Tax=Deefgea sp. CFH1-16 TaxID=2675457 RepID=UPI0015F5ACB9|nr:GtrA family protein [Deefgea sp. CFH1-16]MBM5574775.1 GtrA family protein [Deefgea sp. CFH1-16]
MHRTVKKFFIFAAVGVCGTAIQYLVLWLGVELLALKAAVASGIGYALGSVANYLLNYFLTFKQHGQPHREAISKFYTITGIGWCINTGLMALLVGHWLWGYWPAQLLATAVGLLWNFSGSHWWAFRQKQAEGIAGGID